MKLHIIAISLIISILLLGCGNNTKTRRDTTSTLNTSGYGEWIKPSRSACKSGGGLYNFFGENSCYADWENANSICNAIGGVLPSLDALKTVVTDCGGLIDDYDNINNKAYEACYTEKGFTSYDYWSATIVNGDYWDWVWIMFFNYGSPDKVVQGHDEYAMKGLESFVMCIRERE